MTSCGGGCCRPAPPQETKSDSCSGLPPSSGRLDVNQHVPPPVTGLPPMSPVLPSNMPPVARFPSFVAESDIQPEPKEIIGDHASPPDPNDAPGRRRATFSVLGMDCPSCSPRVVRALTALPSVADCHVDIFAERAVVTYHPSQIQADEMARRVATETGFRCQVVQDLLVEQSQDDSKRRMKILVEKSEVKYPEMDGIRIVHHQAKEIEVEYDARLNPREVLAFFEPYSPTYIPPPPASGANSAQHQVLHLLRLTIISAILCIPVLVFAWAPLPLNPTAYGGTSLALTTLIQLLVARPIYVSGLRALIVQRTIDMDLLVSISTGTAYVFSAVAYACSVAGKPIGDGDETYFETAALLVTLVMLGRLIAAYARRRSTNAVVELSSMQSQEATLADPVTGATKVIPIGLVHVGDVLRVAPGECVPTDGRVVQGEAYVDESSVTGESAPVFKRPGAVLVAGTKLVPYSPLSPIPSQTSQGSNEASKGCCQGKSCCSPTNSLQDGSLDMRVTLSPDSNTLSRMVELMRAAQGARLRVQDMANRVSGFLAPVVLVIAIVVFCAWIGVGVSDARKLADSGARSTARKEAVIAAIGYTVAVLVVSCPCAIALCVPMVAVIAVAVGTKRGILFKTVEALESTTSVEVVVFDKTGTLTLGKLVVETSAYYPQESSPVWWLRSEAGIQGVVRALTESMHPVSVAVHEHVMTLLASISDLDKTFDVRNFPGQGVETTVDGVTVRGGSATWANVHGMGEESTVFVVAVSLDPANSEWARIAHYTLSDSLRPNALATVQNLSSRGLDVHILSGDTQAVVTRTAASLGIPASQARGGCSPEDKAQWIKYLQMGGQECETGCCGSEAKKRTKARKVMFIGDGTNDALALVQSDVGVSLGGGTDVASSAAQIVLLSSLCTGLSDVFTLSRAAQWRIWINFIWAGVYNTLAILFASGVLGEVHIPAQFAGLGELVSVLPVVAVAWSLGIGSW